MTPVRRHRCADSAAILPRLREARRRPFIPRLLVCRFAACRHRVAEREGGNQSACSFWQGVFA
jgi:hypothetical protein